MGKWESGYIVVVKATLKLTNVFSAGMELIQFISRLCLCYCRTRLKACLQGICDWIVLVFKVLQELIDSSRSRFPLWRLPFDITEREMTALGQESSLEEAVLSG